MHSLIKAMEKDNQALRAIINQLQKEPEKVDKNSVNVIDWNKAQEVIFICSLTL